MNSGIHFTLSVMPREYSSDVNLQMYNQSAWLESIANSESRGVSQQVTLMGVDQLSTNYQTNTHDYQTRVDNNHNRRLSKTVSFDMHDWKLA